MNPEEIKYYRTKAVGLLDHRYEDFSWSSTTEFVGQDKTIDTNVRKLHKMQAGNLYGFIKPYVPVKSVIGTGESPTDKMQYLWQLDNPVAPYGTCNVTCIAMCLSGYGILGSGIKNLPEELRAYIEDDQGGDRHECPDLVMGAKWKGIEAEYSDNWNLNEIIAALDEGRPVIINGWFSPSGHFIVLKKFNPQTNRFVTLDPYGEWFNTGYQIGPELGKNVEYSKNIIIAAGISVSGWADSSSWPKDPMASNTYSAIIFPKKA